MLPSGSELLVILLVAFLLFGGERVKDFARTVGGIVRKLQQASKEFQRELNLHIHESDEEKRKKDDLSG
jgi:TatA/E family protein of Tat protein translocase